MSGTLLKRIPFLSRISLLMGRKEGDNFAGHSYSQIVKGISTSIFGRGIAAIVSFVSIPLAVRYLGAERYGVWVTLTSILTWLTVFDLGIGSTAVNGVAEALAKKNFPSAKSKINATYFTLGAIACLLGMSIAIGWHWISWPAVLGARSVTNKFEITSAAAVAIAIFLVNFPFSATQKIMGACQKITLANYWSAAANVLSLILIIVAIRLKAGLPALVAAFAGSIMIMGIISTVWLYRHFDWLVPSLSTIRRYDVGQLLNTGMPFFFVQISGIILYQTDNIVITQVLGAQAVTPYSITWRLFSYASLLQVLAIPTLWPAYADAFARKDAKWIRKTFKYNLQVAMGSTALFVLILVAIGRNFISLWAGPATVPSFGLIVSMAAWTLVEVFVRCESCLLGAVGRVKGQAIYTAVGAAVNVIASVALGRLFGLVGIIMGTLLAYMVCIIVPQTLEVRRVLREKYI